MRNLNELNINPKKPGLTISEVEHFEQQLKRILPSGFKQLLMHNFGGHPELDSIELSSGYGVAVNEFLLPNREPGRGIFWYSELLQEKFGLSKDLLPFASDGGANLFCLDFELPPGKIVILFRDNPLGPPLNLAADFEKFIDALQKNPDFI